MCVFTSAELLLTLRIEIVTERKDHFSIQAAPVTPHLRLSQEYMAVL